MLRTSQTGSPTTLLQSQAPQHTPTAGPQQVLWGPQLGCPLPHQLLPCQVLCSEMDRRWLGVGVSRWALLFLVSLEAARQLTSPRNSPSLPSSLS